MFDLNDYCCTGRLTGDPELRYTQSGKAVAGFTLAVNGVKDEDTIFLKCTAWESLGENCSKFLVKGSRVTARGRLRENKWQTAEGENRKTIELNLLEVIFPPKADSQAGQGGQHRGQGQPQNRQQPQRSQQGGRPQQGQRPPQGQQRRQAQGGQANGWGADDDGWGPDADSIPF